MTITGTSAQDNTEKSIYLYLNVTAPYQPPEPDFQLHINPNEVTLNLSRDEYSVSVQVFITPINDFTKPVELSISSDFLSSLTSDLNKHLEFEFDLNSITAGNIAILNITLSKSISKSYELSIPIKGENTELGLAHESIFNLNIIYYESAPDGEKDSEEDGTMHQWVSVGLLFIVVVVITIFMLKRMRDLTVRDHEKWTKARPQMRPKHPGPRKDMKEDRKRKNKGRRN
jgi:hypothetical protein